MPEITETVVRNEITHALQSIVPDRLASYDAISDDQDLLEFIDSFGFVQLLMSIEPPLGVELDLTAVDLGSIVRFGDLVGFVQSSGVRKLAETG